MTIAAAHPGVIPGDSVRELSTIASRGPGDGHAYECMAPHCSAVHLLPAIVSAILYDAQCSCSSEYHREMRIEDAPGTDPRRPPAGFGTACGISARSGSLDVQVTRPLRSFPDICLQPSWRRLQPVAASTRHNAVRRFP